MLGKGKPLHYEEWVTDRDGRRQLIDTLKTPYYDPDGGPLGLVGIGRDLCSAEKGPAADKADNGPVIVGNIEDDYHSLGRKLVSVFLQSAGWQVIDLAIVVTADFITPPVNDPYLFGQIAAANAISDVYAMGGEPRVCLNLVCFPSKQLPPGDLNQIVAGALDTITEAVFFHKLAGTQPASRS
jgi:hypothetical protein